MSRASLRLRVSERPSERRHIEENSTNLNFYDCSRQRTIFIAQCVAKSDVVLCCWCSEVIVVHSNTETKFLIRREESVEFKVVRNRFP